MPRRLRALLLAVVAAAAAMGASGARAESPAAPGGEYENPGIYRGEWFEGFRVGPDFELARAGEAPRMRPLGRASPGANVAPDGRTAFAFPLGSRPGGTIVTPAGRRVRLRGVGFVQGVGFAPDSGRIAVVEEGVGVHVYRMPRARRERTIPAAQAEAPTFLSPDELVLRDGCRVLRVDLRSEAPAETLSGTACGELLGGGAERAEWVVGEPLGAAGYGVHRALRRVDLRSGAVTTIVEAADGLRGSALAAATGRLCYGRGRALYCGSLVPGDQRRITDLRPHGAFTWERNGTHLLFWGGVPHVDPPPRELFVIDFEQRIARRVPRPHRHETWYLLPGGRRLVGDDGMTWVGVPSAVVRDLERGLEFAVGVADDELEGVMTVPGDDSRFILGRERGSGRDLYWVEVPGASAGTAPTGTRSAGARGTAERDIAVTPVEPAVASAAPGPCEGPFVTELSVDRGVTQALVDPLDVPSSGLSSALELLLVEPPHVVRGEVVLALRLQNRGPGVAHADVLSGGMPGGWNSLPVALLFDEGRVGPRPTRCPPPPEVYPAPVRWTLPPGTAATWRVQARLGALAGLRPASLRVRWSFELWTGAKPSGVAELAL